MRNEDITIIPARGGVKLSYKFLPFIDTCSHDIAAPVSQPIMTEDNTVGKLNNVAERYSLESSPVPNGNNNIPTVQQANIEQQDKITSSPKCPQTKAPAEALEIVSGSVIESTLLQAQSICKVKVRLKGVRDHPTAIALSESSRVRGINLENGLYNTHKGKSEVFVTNTLPTDITLRKGTELGRFQVSKTVEIVNNHQFCDETEQTKQVADLEKKDRPAHC